MKDSFFLFVRLTVPAVIVRRKHEFFRMPYQRTVSHNNCNSLIYGYSVSWLIENLSFSYLNGSSRVSQFCTYSLATTVVASAPHIAAIGNCMSSNAISLQYPCLLKSTIRLSLKGPRFRQKILYFQGQGRKLIKHLTEI